MNVARASMVNQLDETGWRVAGHLQWLWVAASEQITLYQILPGRGFEEAASILGKDYAGFLNHGGWLRFPRYWKWLTSAAARRVRRTR